MAKDKRTAKSDKEKKVTTKKKSVAKATVNKKTKTQNPRKSNKTTVLPQKKRLIVSYERLPERDKDLFEQVYEEGFMDRLQTVTKPDGSSMYVVPLETDENIYMVKVEVVVDGKMSDEDFDKEVLHKDKNEDEDVIGIEGDGQNIKSNKNFQLNHGDYSDVNNFEQEAAHEDMINENLTSLDDIDIENIADN